MTLNVLLIADPFSQCSWIASTKDEKSLIDFVEDRGWEAVEFQSQDYDPRKNTVSSLSEECGYFTVKDLPDVSEEL
tara:strand:- start:470 stop:697 length:228 start_codon:yes stop_codon:yes gene_type:complete